MKCYIVSFEVSADAAKTALTERIKAYGYFCPINATCWAIVTDQSATAVRDYLGTTLATSDKIFVVRSGTEAAWRNTYGEKHTEWLKANL